MEEVLHGDLAGKVAEHDNAIVGTFVGCGIAEGGDIRFAKSMSEDMPFTPLPAVVRVGD